MHTKVQLLLLVSENVLFSVYDELNYQLLENPLVQLVFTDSEKKRKSTKNKLATPIIPVNTS